MTEFSYCADELKKSDYYRYICCLFTPHKFRDRLYALYAFNFEVSKIKDITTEHMTGLIRLTWWIEAINEIYSGQATRNHEVVKALGKTVKDTNIPREYLEHIVIGRETDLGLKHIPDFEALQKYIDDTSVNLLKASLHVLDIKTKEALEAAQHIGTAYAIIGLMRSLKWAAPKKQALIPHDMLERNSITIEDIAEGHHLEKFKPIVKELCAKVDKHLKQADLLRKSLPKEALPVYLHSVIAKIFLKRIRKNHYDLFHSDLESGKVWVLVRMFLAAKFHGG